MSISLVEVVTNSSETIQLPIGDPSSGYILKSIDGLDPVKAEIVTSTFGTIDGSQFQSARREARNPVIKLGYAPDYVETTISSLKKNLYSKMIPKGSVTLRFHQTDGPTVEIAGRVESLESPLFVQDPEVNVSIICPDPDFYSVVNTVKTGNTTPGSSGIVFDYDGEVFSGVLFKLLVNRSLSEFSITHIGSDGSINNMEFIYPLVANDVLEISTVPGNKGAWLTRSNNRGSVLYGMSPESVWFRLTPGSNELRVQAAGAAIPYEINYTEKFGGL